MNLETNIVDIKGFYQQFFSYGWLCLNYLKMPAKFWQAFSRIRPLLAIVIFYPGSRCRTLFLFWSCSRCQSPPICHFSNILYIGDRLATRTRRSPLFCRLGISLGNDGRRPTYILLFRASYY